MKIVSSFTHPQVVPNLYECLCSAEHKGRYSEECGKQSSSGAPLTSIVIFFPIMEVNGAPKQPGYKLSSEYLPLCSAEQRNSYRFGTTWGWVNDDRIFIFGWIIPLRSALPFTSQMWIWFKLRWPYQDMKSMSWPVFLKCLKCQNFVLDFLINALSTLLIHYIYDKYLQCNDRYL